MYMHSNGSRTQEGTIFLVFLAIVSENMSPLTLQHAVCVMCVVSVCVCVCVCGVWCVRIRPILLLRFPLLRFVDSNFPGNLPMDTRIPRLKLKIMLEANPLKSRILVRRLAVMRAARLAQGVEVTCHPPAPAGDSLIIAIVT